MRARRARRRKAVPTIELLRIALEASLKRAIREALLDRLLNGGALPDWMRRGGLR